MQKGKKNSHGRRREAALAAFKQLAEDKDQFEAAQLADTMAKDDKEIQELQNKYDAFIRKERDFQAKKGVTKAQAAATNETIAKLETEKEKAVLDLRERQEKDQFAQIVAFRDQMNDKMETELEKERDQINNHFDQLQKDAGTNADQLEKIEIGRQASLADAEIREKTRLEDEKRKLDEAYSEFTDNKTANDKAKINKKYDDEIADFKKHHERTLANAKEYDAVIAAIERDREAELEKLHKAQIKAEKQAAIQAAQDISNAVFTISANNRHAETDAKIKSLEDQKDKELSNENLTADQKAAINAKYAKEEADIKTAAWKADQAAAVEQAIINAALAITKIFATMVPPFSFIEAAAVAVATGAQIATIEAQPVPQFADGGYSAVSSANPVGWVKRPTLFTNSASGRPFIAGEGYKSEYIISSQQLRDPAIANFVGMMEANRGVRRFESGGFSYTETKTKPVSHGSPGNNNNSADLAETNRLLAGLHDKFDAWGQKPWDFNMRQLKIAQDKIDAINNNSKA